MHNRPIRDVYYTLHFIRALKKLPKVLQAEMRERDRWFKDNCFDSRLRTHKLSGKLDGFWSFSLTHKYRVLFHFANDAEVILDDIGDHALYR
jgi:mRNA-degrading endonuclease YafQ of YafQ-DinJ toxin-antitoxin module